MSEFYDQNRWFEQFTQQLIRVRKSKNQNDSPTEQENNSTLPYILVRVGDRLFGVALETVQRIAPPLWTRVPLMPEHSACVMGVFGEARQIYTVLSLAALLERERYLDYISQKKHQALLVVKESVLPNAPRIALAVSQPLGVVYLQLQGNGQVGVPFKEHDHVIFREGEKVILINLGRLLGHFLSPGTEHKGE